MMSRLAAGRVAAAAAINCSVSFSISAWRPAAIRCKSSLSTWLYQKRWILVLVQFAAYCATETWLWVAGRLVEFRQQIGQPWTAAATILVAVALLTLLAGLLMNSRCMRERYPA